VVAYAKLDCPDVEELLKLYSRYPAIKGIRQILNHHPENPGLTWPKVTEDFILNPTWIKNYALLAKYNLSFDCQLNPHQFSRAVEVIAAHPNIPVIINHIGTLHLGTTKSEEEKNLAVWRRDLKLLAQLPNVYMKLSMKEFIQPGWITDTVKRKFILDLVREVIRLFSPSRCMFASNWPVEHRLNITLVDLYYAFEEIASVFTEKERHDLFYGTAERAYRLHEHSAL